MSKTSNPENGIKECIPAYLVGSPKVEAVFNYVMGIIVYQRRMSNRRIVGQEEKNLKSKKLIKRQFVKAY